MKLKLTGTYEQETYKYHPEIQRHLTTGSAIVPIKATMSIENGILRFRFNKYDGFDVGENPKDHEVIWADKFRIKEEKPDYYTWLDNSGKKWEQLIWLGEYISWAGKLLEFKFSMEESGFMDVCALWPHKRYRVRSIPKEVRYESTIFDADEVTQKMVKSLFKEFSDET